MDYINSVTLQIKTLREVCSEVGASIPAGQSCGDWFPILPSDPPIAGEGQVVEPSAPVESDGAWYMGWSVRAMTPEEIEQRNAQYADAIADRRYQAEVAGITINGMSVETDDRAKLLINGAALEAVIDPDYVMQWKTFGGFIELTGAQVIGIARAVRAHVQACFDREAELLDALANGTITDAMLEQGWP